MQAPSQEVSLLPKTAPRSDTIQLTAIASNYDPTPAQRGAAAKSVSFREVSASALLHLFTTGAPRYLPSVNHTRIQFTTTTSTCELVLCRARCQQRRLLAHRSKHVARLAFF